jgi:hypothetical protein
LGCRDIVSTPATAGRVAGRRVDHAVNTRHLFRN